MRSGPFPALFALSGAAALVAEVVWTRLLRAAIGHGLAAASAMVLAALLGWAASPGIGAAAGGRTGQRLAPRTALRGCAALEAAIAAVALLLPGPFSLFDRCSRRSTRMAPVDSSLRGSSGWRSVCSCSRCRRRPWAQRSRSRRGGIVRSAGQIAVTGRLYAANTLGAAVGAIVTGFVLLPAVGLTGATIVRVIAQSHRGRWRVMFSRETGEIVAISRRRLQTRQREKPESPTPVRRPWLAAATLGVTGLASLTLQVVWTRLLA